MQLGGNVKRLLIWLIGLANHVDEPTKSFKQTTQPTITAMYYSQTRSVPEIFEIIEKAKTKEDQIKILQGYSQNPTFIFILQCWLNCEYEDFSDVKYVTHTLPDGGAPQTIANNIMRIRMLDKTSKEQKASKDKILANVLHSINQSEIVLLLALIQGKLEEVYPNVNKELVLEALPFLKR